MIIRDGKGYLPQVKQLILEYTDFLGRDLSFQNIDDELNDLKKKYLPPNGEILVALNEDDVLGMVAYYRHDEKTCEMKRLYVKPDARGMHLGDALISEITSHARDSGYEIMLLDTIKPLKPAIGLYQKHGFKECEPYYNNPMDDVIYMKNILK